MLLEITRLQGPMPVPDLCIVGAGPAGLVLAEALGDTGRSILVLESGGLLPNAFAQSLNQGPVAGVPYAGLAHTRFRQVGGTARVWNTPVARAPGAKYVPLDPKDFEATPAAPWSGWPFGLPELTPCYQRAQRVCGLGPFCYEASHWPTAERPALPVAGTPLRSGIYQFGTARRLIDRITERLLADPNVQLCPQATVASMEPRNVGCGVASVTALAPDGRRVVVPVRDVVLAGGAVENARLLLLVRERFPGMDPGDWLGRCFMEHPRDSSLVLELRPPDDGTRFRFYDLHQAADGTLIGGRLSADVEAFRAAGLPPAAVTLLPEWRSLPGVLARLLGQRPSAMPSPGYGWSETGPGRCERCRLVVNLEQRPSRSNRIVLDQTTDPFGLPRARLELRWTDAEQEGLDRLRSNLADWLPQHGLGRLEWRSGVRPDLNAHHHAGTTRMHEDPRGGVVDPHLQVHGIDNLFIAGASVFPAAGWANPVLTIVALSLRLSDYLRQRF